MNDQADEILRLRRRYHELQKTVMGLSYRVDELEKLEPVVNEVLLAQRVTAGVKAALSSNAAAGLNRWTKIGIAAGVASGIGAFLLSVLELVFRWHA